MANAHGHTLTEIRNPGAFPTPGSLHTLLIVFAAIGVLAFAGGLMADPQHAWASFLQNHFYFLSLAMGGAFFATVQWVSGAMWSSPVRRLSEACTAYLPVAVVMFLVLAVGMLMGKSSGHYLYRWMNPEVVRESLAIQGKTGYLNAPFFIIRNLIALGVWIWLIRKMVGNSLAQDASKDPAYTMRNRVLGPIFLIVFGITYTMASFDLLMSLDPEWFSTMFGVYCFAGMFYAILAVTCLLAIYFRSNGKLAGIVNENHLHDLGKFMFAFAVFYAYIGFSQFMLIWYANLPEETGYYLHRMHGGWWPVSIFLVVGKFLTPFFLLLTRDAKRNTRVLAGTAIFMLFAHWIDILWLVQPEYFSEGPHISWIDVGVTLGFIGLFGLMVARFLAKNSVLAVGDPRLEEAVFHHHQ